VNSQKPKLSVLIPTYGRNTELLKLLNALNSQTLSGKEFEVIIVDDGSPIPTDLSDANFIFPIKLIRQKNGGPGSARNTGIGYCRADWTVILNDDARPAKDCLESHYRRSQSVGEKVAVLGRFDFTACALESPFIQLLQNTDLLFNYIDIRKDHTNDWNFFWTCNLGISTEAIKRYRFNSDVFPEALCEDIELGYRLHLDGWSVMFDERIQCEHDHKLTVKEFFNRAVKLGKYLNRMGKLHPALQIIREGSLGEENKASSMSVLPYEKVSSKIERFLEKIEQEKQGVTLSTEALDQLYVLVRKILPYYIKRGWINEENGINHSDVISMPSNKVGVSIIILSYNDIARTQRCIESIKSTLPDAVDPELIIVDNGSTDGSIEFLDKQKDIKLLKNLVNLGAPRARNLGLAAATKDWLVVVDNDVVVTSGWLEGLLRHSFFDPKIGCVGPVSNRASQGQAIKLEALDSSDNLKAISHAIARDNFGQSRVQPLLSSFCLMFPKKLLEQVGYFDEQFSPWGFEDDDFTLRATIAGYRNKVAQDVFVFHDEYADESKASARARQLELNWRKFCLKWAGKADLRYGDPTIVSGLIPNHQKS